MNWWLSIREFLLWAGDFLGFAGVMVTVVALAALYHGVVG